jgi:ubiquinone/menaquinone biosynthesis C-methylase UbiE
MMRVRESFYRFYWTVQKVIAPSLKHAQNVFEEVLKDNVKAGCSWLDLGCGHQLLSPWRFSEEEHLSRIPALLVGLDYDLASLQKHRSINHKVRGNILRMPFKDGSFDLVTANMVFEHLKEPSSQLQEIFRILKPGGSLIFHTPNTLSYATCLGRLVPDFLSTAFRK